MYNIKLYDYVPKPEPAESGRIVAAHYYPSWSKGENGLTHEFEDIHDYPERTPLMGYYEDKNPEVIDWEIKWALEHGINCFIYCWYRKKSNEGKPVTVEDMRLSSGLHKGLFNARYGNMMKFAIMYEASTKWGGTDPEDMQQNLMPFWMENYFSRENYLVIDNKPVLYIYDNYHQLHDSITPAEHKKMLDRCREYAKTKGFDGMYFGIQDVSNWDTDSYAAYKEYGYDFSFRYCGAPGNNFTSKEVYDYQYNICKELIQKDPYRCCATVGAFLDWEPRLKTLPYAGEKPGPGVWKYPDTRWYMTFEDYRKLLKEVKELADNAPEDSMAHKVLMIDHFNEWDEGHFVLPSYRFGFRHLQAIREELTERNNLPDYRTPEALGFGPYDEVWGGKDIDLSEGNWRKLDESEFKYYKPKE